MAYYKFKDKVGLVDAADSQQPGRPKKKSRRGNPCGLIIDARVEGSKGEYPTNDEAAFVIRFLVQGLDTATVAQLFSSEYSVDLEAATAEVNTVIARLQSENLLDPVPSRPPKHNHGANIADRQTSTGIEINASINPWGDIWFWGPF